MTHATRRAQWLQQGILVSCLLTLSCDDRPKPSAPADLIRYISEKEFGSGKIISIDFHGDSAFIKFRAEEGWTNNGTRQKLFDHAFKFFGSIYRDPLLSALQTCGLSPHLMLHDHYGHEELGQVGEIWMNRILAKKFNFEAYVDPDEFYGVLQTESKCILHPSLKPTR